MSVQATERYSGVTKTAFPSVATAHPIGILSIKFYYTILPITKLYQRTILETIDHLAAVNNWNKHYVIPVIQFRLQPI